MSRAAADRLSSWKPLSTLTDLVHTIADTWRLVDENRTILNRLESLMADTSALLNEVAAGLRGPLATSIQDLIAENASLRGEDTAETGAAANVKAAFDELAGKFTADPSTPDVPPLDPAPVGGGDLPAEPTA
jgi:hypothetical protein